MATPSNSLPADILQYALTLEHLEDNFYRQGLAKFTEAQFAAAGFDATFYANIQKVSSDETEHVKFLTSGLTGMFPILTIHTNLPYPVIFSLEASQTNHPQPPEQCQSKHAPTTSPSPT